MTDYRMQGGPYDGRVFDEVPDGYRATGGGSGVVSGQHEEPPLTAEWVGFARKSKDIATEQMIADDMWSMGEGEFRDRHGL